MFGLKNMLKLPNVMKENHDGFKWLIENVYKAISDKKNKNIAKYSLLQIKNLYAIVVTTLQ